jgi:hypothetical protein
VISTCMVGYSLLDARRRMEVGVAKVRIPVRDRI